MNSKTTDRRVAQSRKLLFVAFVFLESSCLTLQPKTSKHLELIPLKIKLALRMIDGNLVVSAPAGGAIVAVFHLHARKQPPPRRISQAGHLQKRGHLTHPSVLGDQLVTCWENHFR